MGHDVTSERVKRELCPSSIPTAAASLMDMGDAHDCESEDRDASTRKDFSDYAQPTSSGGIALRPKGRAQPPLVCQVPGCEASLLCLREYYQRYKICEYHRQLDQMVGCNGELQRFCQQCGRFHAITAFDDNKRSCRERLAKHNERRRRRTAGDLSTYGKPNASGAEAHEYVHESSNIFSSSGTGASWGRQAFTPELSLPSSYSHRHSHLAPRDSFHLQLQMMQLQDQKMMMTSAAAAAIQPAAALFTPSLHPIDAYILQTRPMYPVDIPIPIPQPPSSWDRPSDSAIHHSHHSNISLSERGSHSMSRLPYPQSLEPELHAAQPQQPVSHLGAPIDITLHPGFVPGAYNPGANRAVFTRGVASAPDERRGRRKHCSWPLAQLHMQIPEPTAREMGLITGGTGDGMGEEASGGIYPSLSDEAARAAGVGASSILSHASFGMSQRLSQPSDIRVLGENQTLAALWENIIIDDA